MKMENVKVICRQYIDDFNNDLAECVENGWCVYGNLQVSDKRFAMTLVKYAEPEPDVEGDMSKDIEIESLKAELAEMTEGYESLKTVVESLQRTRTGGGTYYG